jgi:hypothetical protein
VKGADAGYSGVAWRLFRLNPADPGAAHLRAAFSLGRPVLSGFTTIR